MNNYMPQSVKFKKNICMKKLRNENLVRKPVNIVYIFVAIPV